MEKTKQQIKDDELNIEVKDFVYDDKSANIMSNSFTMDSGFFYNFSHPNIKNQPAIRSGSVPLQFAGVYT